MPILQVTWECRGPNNDPSVLVQQLQRISSGRCARAMAHTWIIETEETAERAWASMTFCVPVGDALVVTEVASFGGYQFTDREASPVLFKLVRKPGAEGSRP